LFASKKIVLPEPLHHRTKTRPNTFNGGGFSENFEIIESSILGF